LNIFRGPLDLLQDIGISVMGIQHFLILYNLGLWIDKSSLKEEKNGNIEFEWAFKQFSELIMDWEVHDWIYQTRLDKK
jgi:hypothetical protein